METGPPCYGDLESDELELLRSFRVRTIFLPDVLKEVEDHVTASLLQDVRAMQRRAGTEFVSTASATTGIGLAVLAMVVWLGRQIVGPIVQYLAGRSRLTKNRS